jgi:hypothetical protein
MNIISAGIFRDLPADVYFADPCVEPSFTQSLAKILIEQSPLHAKLAHPRLAPPKAEDEEDDEKYDKAKAIGNAAHALMLGRGKAIAVGEFDSWRSKDAKAFKAVAIEAKREPVLRKHFDVAVAMVCAANDQLEHIPGAEHAFGGGGASEVVIAACDGGLWCRSMIDWMTDDLREVWDYKTSGMSVSPYATGKLMASGGWHIQAAMHSRILDAIDSDGAGRRRFYYVAQENEAPYSLTVNEIGEAALTIGRKQLAYAIGLWRDCMAANNWPGYPQRIIRPELPGWAENSWLAREVAEDDDPIFVPQKRFDPTILQAG